MIQDTTYTMEDTRFYVASKLSGAEHHFDTFNIMICIIIWADGYSDGSILSIID